MELDAVAWAMASEGSFTIQKVRNSLQPKISINNTDKVYLDKFCNIVGYGNRGTHNTNLRNPHWKPIFHWYLSSFADCLKFCESIVDYMPIKRRQVELIIEFCKRGKERKKCLMSVEDHDWFIYDELRFLNRRGM